MSQLDVRIVDCRPGEPYADRQFIDAALISDTQPLRSLLTAAGISQAQHAQWEALDVETDVIDDQRLLQLRQQPCTLVNLRRRVGAGEKRAAGAGTSHGGKVARSSGAGAASSAGAASREPAAGYAAEAWPCAEGENRMDELGSSVPLLNALLELVDNAIRAVLARRAKEPSSPLEIYIRVWQQGDVWLLSVRDTGIGMDTSQIPGWGRLHVSEAITRQHADGTPARGLEESASDNPFYGSGLLHFAGVGGKSAAMAVSARDGYVDVLSLGVDAGDTVVNLQLHKEVARERQLAVIEQQLVPRDERAALPPLKDVQALPGGWRRANAVERGECEAPDGGRWQGAGTQVTVTRLNEAMVHLVGDEAGQAKVRRLLAHVYHAYIHPREAPQLNVGAPPGSRTVAAAAANGDLPPPILISAFGVNLATVDDDLTSQILKAGGAIGAGADKNVFRLSVALVRPDGEVSHIGARIFYNPCVDGRPTRPEDALVAAGILSPTQLIVLRAGRVLTNNDMPATVTVPQLRAAWVSDTQAMKKRGRDAGRFLARCTGFVAVGPSSEAKSDKTRLNEDSMHFAALAAIFASSEEDAHEKLAVPKLRGVRMFMLPFRDDGSCDTTAGWQPFNLMAVRTALISFAECQHERDTEAGPFAPPDSLPLDLLVASAEERERLKCPDASRLTGWLGVELPQGTFPQGQVEHDMRVSLTLPDTRRGRTAAGLYTLRCFVTLGSADDDELRITTGQVILDPWNATKEGRSELRPIAGATPAGVNGGRLVLPMRLVLNKAVVLPISVLAESAYNFKVLERNEWNRQVEEKSKLLPSRLFAVTNFLDPSEQNCLVDGIRLEHDALLPLEWCITILNLGKAATELEPGAAIKSSHMFVSDAKLTLTVSRADGTGGALEVLTKDTLRGLDLRRGNDAVSRFGNNGRGLYLFEPAGLRSLQRPGEYVLTFTAAGHQVDEFGLEPLVVRITRKRAPLRRVLDADAEWSVCCHPGACVPGLLRCVQGRLGDALAATVGSADGVGTTLYMSQKDSNGNDLGFPNDAWRYLKLGIWDTTDETEHDGSGRKQRQLEMLTLHPVRIGDVSVSVCGKDLEIRNVRLQSCVLPTGDDLDVGNRTGPGSRGKKPSAPLQALLRIGIDDAHVEREGNTIKLLGGAECPLTIFPGHAKRIAVSPGEDSMQGLISGTLLPPLAISLLDASGNTTASLPPAAVAAEGKMSMTLSGLTFAKQRDTPTESVVSLSREGTAVLRLKVTAMPGSPFSVELKLPGLHPTKLCGVAAQREVRLCLADDPEQLADAVLAGEAGVPLAALGNVFAHVCLPGATEPDTEFGGRLYLHATGAPASWCAHVAGLLMQAAQGRAQLPPTLTLPLASCRVTLYVLPEKRTGAASAPLPANAARIEIEVTAPPLSRLEARAPEEEATRGSDVRLVLIALAESGAQVPVPQELLMALLPSDPAVELRSSEPLGDGSAAVIVRVDAAPGTYPVFLSAPPSADGSRPTVSVTWQVSLVAGAPERAEFTLRGAAADAAGGDFRIARGDAVPFVATFVDEDGAECAASATDGCILRLAHAEDAAWLIPDTCNREWHARDNAVTLDGLTVSPEASLGAHVVTMHLFPAHRGGNRRKGGSSQPKPMLELELRLRVVAGTRPAALLLSQAGPLVVEAGAALLDVGVVSVMDASDQPVPASAVAAQHLTLEVRGTNPSAPMDPRKVRSSAKVNPAPGVAGGGFDCAAATPVLRAPDLAGMYNLTFRLENGGGGAPLMLHRALTVVGAASGQLTCKFKSPVEQLPSCVEDGAAPGQSALFAARLDIVFLDRFGNAVDLSAAMPQRGVRLRFERAAPAPGQPPLPQPVKAEGDEKAAAAAAKEGRVTFTQLLAVPHWPSGEYCLVVEPRPERWTPPRAPDSVLCGDAVHAFQYLDATAAQDERERARRARDAEHAALAAATALREARDAATRAAAATQSAATTAKAAQGTAASTAAAAQAARAAAQAASVAAAAAEQHIAEVRAERDAPSPTDDGTPPPPAPPHVDAFRAALNRRRGGGSLGAAPVSEGGLGASFAGRADVMGLLSDLLRAETPALGDALARAVGNAALSTVLVRNAAGRNRCVERLPPTLQLLRLDHPAAQARFWRGAVEKSGQRKLIGLPALPPAPGLLDYCVNLVHLSEQHLDAVVEAGPPAPAAGAAAPLWAARVGALFLLRHAGAVRNGCRHARLCAGAPAEPQLRGAALAGGRCDRGLWLPGARR